MDIKFASPLEGIRSFIANQHKTIAAVKILASAAVALTGTYFVSKIFKSALYDRASSKFSNEAVLNQSDPMCADALAKGLRSLGRTPEYIPITTKPKHDGLTAYDKTMNTGITVGVFTGAISGIGLFCSTYKILDWLDKKFISINKSDNNHQKTYTEDEFMELFGDELPEGFEIIYI